MWLVTKYGFFSVVQKTGEKNLTVRARVREDLDALRERYLPSLSPTVERAGSDYRYRAKASHVDFAEAMKKMVLDVSYCNFKDCVAVTQGKKRERIYHKPESVSSN